MGPLRAKVRKEPNVDATNDLRGENGGLRLCTDPALSSEHARSCEYDRVSESRAHRALGVVENKLEQLVAEDDVLSQE